MGGFKEKDGSQKTCEKLNLEKFEWESFPSLKENRWSCSACIVESVIYRSGGYQYQNTDRCTRTTNKCEQYDPIRKEWRKFTSMQKERAEFGCASYNGEIYIVGG